MKVGKGGKNLKNSPEDIAKALLLGWKTRMILNSTRMKNMKSQVMELLQHFSTDLSNNFVKTAKDSYLKCVNECLSNESWYFESKHSKNK